jgi:GT2 family glycosyltransferase
MDLSIIVVSWDVKDKLNKCLGHLFLSQTNFSFEIIVVDNGSHDGTVEMVQAEYPEVKLIANDGNLGFSRAVNQAYRISTGDIIFLLNPDNFVFPLTIDDMMHWLNLNHQAAIAGCRLVDRDSNNIGGQVRKFPGFFDQLAIILKWPYIFPGIIDRYLCSNFDYNQPSPVDSVRGSAMFIRRAVLESVLPYERFQSGELLDERFFIWFEDVDLCKTFKEAELEVWYTPAARCFDMIGQSFTQLPRMKAQALFRDSMLKYFKKWKPVWQFAIIWIAWPLGMTLAFVFNKLGFERKNNS